MNEWISQSAYCSVVLTLGVYFIGCAIQKKIKAFNPFLFSIVVVVAFLALFRVDYQIYYDGNEIINFLLTPATVCLAIPLYQQLQILRENWHAILAGILSGVVANMVSILILALIFGLSHNHYITLLPKSVTTAIAIGVSEELGGMTTLTVCVLIVTGMIGNIFAPHICKLFRIHEPVAKGVAIGTACHAMGTARALTMGEIEGAISSLSIAVAGLMTVIVASVFANFY
ncbi:MAG: LrgB family protein [Clostridiales bacterium]|nr:LrgB family protein [Clostridiales bacterium]